MRYTDTVLSNGPSFGDWLPSCLGEADVAAMRTGFLSLPAVEDAAPQLLALLQRGGQLLIVAGGAPDQADPDALIRLSELLTPFGDQATLRVVVHPDEFQNAKTYYMRFPDGHAEAWIGSANLTRGGLQTNHEAAVFLDSREPAEAEIIEDVLRGIQAFRDRPFVDVRVVETCGDERRGGRPSDPCAAMHEHRAGAVPVAEEIDQRRDVRCRRQHGAARRDVNVVEGQTQVPAAETLTERRRLERGIEHADDPRWCTCGDEVRDFRQRAHENRHRCRGSRGV